MPTLNLPELPGHASATVARWRVEPGVEVQPGQAVVELAAEVATIEVNAPQAGCLTDLAPVGRTLQPSAVLATWQPAQPATAMPAASAPVPTPAAPPKAAAMSDAAVIPILMPEAGNSMEEGTILKWLVKPGDAIALGQIICEIETDKATMEYESPAAGRLARIVVEENDSIAVKQPIAFLAADDAAVDQYLAGDGTPSQATTSADATTPSPAASPQAAGVATSPSQVSGQRIKASPAARKLATQRGIDLASVTAATGPGGRILTTDLVHVAAPTPDTPHSTPAASPDGVRKPMTRMRRAIAANLQKSKQTVPHFYVRITIDADPLLAFYKAQKPATGCTINDVIVAAVARTMMQFPAIRSRVDGNDLVEFNAANIGVAVGVPDGLVVPVIMGVDRMPLAQLARESKRIVEAARNGKPENMGRGNFTISNLGMFGVEEFAAIINPPESAILAVAAARETVIVKDGSMRPGRVMTLTLSVDHRVVDGLLAAQFAAKLKELLESPQPLAA